MGYHITDLLKRWFPQLGSKIAILCTLRGKILLSKWARPLGGRGHRLITSDLKEISTGFTVYHIIPILTQASCSAVIFMLVYIEGKAFTWPAYLYTYRLSTLCHVLSSDAAKFFLPRLRSGWYVATRTPNCAFNSSGLHEKLRGPLWINCLKGCGDKEVMACSKVLFRNLSYKLYKYKPENVKSPRVTYFRLRVPNNDRYGSA
jgi:hypothetical protein